MKKGKNQAQRLMNPLLKINESLKKGKKNEEICSKSYETFRSHRNKSYESIETNFIFFCYTKYFL
jgi:hypothetical protein